VDFLDHSLGGLLEAEFDHLMAGKLRQAQGDFAAAHDTYLACSRLFQAHNHTHGAAATLANAGRLAHKLGNLAEAADLLQESLTLKREIHDGRGVVIALYACCILGFAKNGIMPSATNGRPDRRLLKSVWQLIAF
jgi:tetratricopeptide (TPR) repeat protein